VHAETKEESMNSLQSIAHRTIAMALLTCACANQPTLTAATQPVTVESRTITVRIDRPFDKVYDFLVDPANWNQWAFGLGKNIRRSQTGWIADDNGGVAHVQFTPRNPFGVVDHTVTRASGQRVYLPMRLIANATGCELLFTLYREPNLSDAQFASDAAYVQRDLNRLKSVLEK
jgi:hypothetical protein